MEYLHWIITTVLWFGLAVLVYGGIIIGLTVALLRMSRKH